MSERHGLPKNDREVRTLKHIRFHHTFYAKGHLVSSVHRRNHGNNTPYFLIAVIVVTGGCIYFFHSICSSQ